MHRGTPVLLGGKDLYIYHKGGTEGSDRLKFYNISSNEIQVKIKSAWTIHTIDDKEFDPASMISYDWKKVIPGDLYIERLYAVRVGDVASRSKYLHLLRMAPIDWPRTGKSRKLDEDAIATWDPVPCMFYPGNIHVMSDGFKVDTGYSGVDIDCYDASDTRGVMSFDPKAAVQQWQTHTIKVIESALEKYEKKLSGVGNKKE